ncbi:MAG: hypothetical protein FJ265_03890 [Planctomycetes bacterium]|nr:hypothetical protein [Planctomycetota bacterium]
MVMRPNPVILPAYAAPENWALALIAMWAEIRTTLALLRSMDRATGTVRPLFLLNLMTWLAFLLAMDWCDSLGLLHRWFVWVVAALEAIVVTIEANLIWAMLARPTGSPSARPLPFVQALRLSLLGNLVSITVGIALPAAVFWLLGLGTR